MINMKRRLAPIMINKEFWVYRDKKSFTFVHEIRIDSKYVRTDQFKIDLRRLLVK